MRTRILMVMLAACALQGCGRALGDYRAQPRDPQLLHAAVGQLTSVIVYDIFSPPQASRVYAYSSIAAYEALRHDYPEYRTLAGQVNGLTPVPAPDSGAEYYLPLASVHAFMTVGRALTFSRARMDSLRSEMDERFRRTGIPRPVYDRSIAYGDRVAQHVLAWASKDHFAQTRGYPKFTVTSEPGLWTPTPPAYMDAVEPNWARLRPFVMDSASQFRPKPPHPFDMKEGAPFYRQVKEVYDTGKQLTDEQRAIAAFWDCNPYVMNVRGHAMFATKKITPGGHWMGIVGVAARKSGADPMRSAEAYARTAIALADGFISAWDEKYRSSVVRPETVINAYLDEGWLPLLQTPPFPEYTSGHSVISTAAAAVLTDQFGGGFAFADSTEVEYGLPARSFSSFEQAAAEAAMSRLYGGIHYRMAIEEGVIEGRKVGDLVVQRLRTRGEDATPERTIAANPRPASAAVAGR
ncbi:MAG TPA: vanadium-dependent haloperoxidase [Gemmatimonadaceae bacterium]|nr:vanadium-dependent haloperoxidase [Gemmatimonadaceae bacterium]